MRRSLLLLIFAGQLAFSAPQGKPNIVIILADDLGWNAVGWHNPEIKTPHLDQLCKEGIELDNMYVSPMCSPTRAGLLTGRYPIRYGCARAVIPPWRDFGLPIEETTLADALGAAGYERRGVFGKWHLGHARKRWHPNQRGFTDFIGCYNGAIDYFTHEREGEPDWHKNEAPLKQEGYTTTLIGRNASGFIREAAKGDAPYFCYIPFNAPHSPHQAPPDYLKQYAHIKDQKRKTYFAMITAMDDAIGEILKTIDETGEADNTIVWFFSDNGGIGSIADNNKPLHGSKLTTYDGGVRAVACVRYPAGYPGGRKITDRTLFIDVMPSMLRLAGTDASTMKNPFDGIDLTPLLNGTVTTLPARDLYFYHGQSGEGDERNGVISGDWKLVVNGPKVAGPLSKKNRIQLFNMTTDPNETTDVAKQHPELVETLWAKLATFRALQPANGVPPYGDGHSKDFTAPKNWKIELD